MRGDTHIPSDISRGYTKDGDSHVTVTPASRVPGHIPGIITGI